MCMFAYLSQHNLAMCVHLPRTVGGVHHTYWPQLFTRMIDLLVSACSDDPPTSMSLGTEHNCSL